MQKGWKQTWKNLLFQHFEISNTASLQKLLPKNCLLDSFEGKHYLGLVSMQMTNVRHRATKEFVWFKHYHELNVRTYITLDGEPGILFLSLDVDSLISVLGARILYGLPYHFRTFESQEKCLKCFNRGQKVLDYEYNIDQNFQRHTKESFAFWVTERYFFANQHLGFNFMGRISHEPWHLCSAEVTATNLEVLDKYDVLSEHRETFFCEQIEVVTSQLKRI